MFGRRQWTIACFALLLGLWLLSTESAESGVTKIEGDNVEDATLRSGAAADWNHGSCTFIAVSYTQVYVGLIRAKNLDTEIGQAGEANITSAVCSLYAYIEHASTDNVGIHRVFKPWVEGSSCESDAAGCTWNDWSSDASEWTTEGCLCANDDGEDNSTDDGDCDASTKRDRTSTADDTEDCDGVASWHVFEIDTAIANGWYQGTINEEGIAIVASEGYHVYYRSTEYGTASQRPFFVFTWTAAPDTVSLVTSKADSTLTGFSIPYQVSTNIDPPSDSVTVYVSTIDDEELAIPKGQVTADDSATITVTGLQEDTEYFLWVYAWATDSSDTVVDTVTVGSGSTVFESVILRPAGNGNSNFGMHWEDQAGLTAEYGEIDEAILDTTDYWREWLVDSNQVFVPESLLATAYPESVEYSLVINNLKGHGGMLEVGRSEFRSPDYNNYTMDTVWADSGVWDTVSIRTHVNPADDSVFEQSPDFLQWANYGWFVNIYRRPDPGEDDSVGLASDDSTAQLATNKYYAFKCDAGFDGWVDSLAFKFQDADGVANCKMALYSNYLDFLTDKPHDLLDSTAEFDASTGWNKVPLVNGYEVSSNPVGEDHYWIVVRVSAADSLRLNNETVSSPWWACSGSLTYAATQWPLTDLYNVGSPAVIANTKGACWVTGYPIPYIRVASAWLKIQYSLHGSRGLLAPIDERDLIGGGIIH